MAYRVYNAGDEQGEDKVVEAVTDAADVH